MGDLLCLTACAALSWQAVQAREELAQRSQAVLLVLSLLWFAADARAGYLALTVAAIALLVSRPRPATARSAWLWLALSGHGLWGLVVLKLAAPLLMPVETGLVGLAARIFGAAAGVHGTRIEGPEGWYIYVLEGCSSLHGLSLDLLVWASVLVLAEVRVTFRAAELLAAALLATILANTLRILPMARNHRRITKSWHNGWGASLFGDALALVAVVPAAMAGRGADRAG